jgi:hypothetical protein
MFNHLNSTPMVTTRKQDALQAESKEAAAAPDNLSKHSAPENSNLKPTSPTPEDETQLDGEEASCYGGPKR